MEIKKYLIISLFLLLGGLFVSGGQVVVKDGELNVTEDFLVDSDVLYVNSANNRVGIGTASPNEKLTVDGFVSLRAYNYNTTPTVDSEYAKLFVHNSSNGNDIFTKLLMHLDGAHNCGTDACFIDSSPEEHEVLTEGATLSNDGDVFGPTGAYIIGGDYITVEDSDDWDFGTGDFTIDFWVRFNTVDATHGLVTHYTDTNNYFIFMLDSAGKLHFDLQVGGERTEFYSSVTCSTLTFYHFALVRSGSAITIYRNGVEVASGAYASWGNFTGLLKIGMWDYPSYPYYHAGHMDEIRISKGVARWTENFNTKTAAYGGTDRMGLYYKDDNGLIVELVGAGNYAWTSYWGKTGNDVYYDDGNVGIGTTSPNTLLDVNGEAEISDTSTGGNAGTDLCIDANNRICKCGSCA